MGEYSYIIYGVTWCGFCKKAMQLLQNHSLEYKFLDLTGDEEYLVEVKQFYSTKTVPVVLEVAPSGHIKYIGGFTDLKEKMETNEK